MAVSKPSGFRQCGTAMDSILQRRPNLRSRRPSTIYPTLFQKRGVKTHASVGRGIKANRHRCKAQLPCSWSDRYQTFWLSSSHVSESAEVSARSKAHAQASTKNSNMVPPVCTTTFPFVDGKLRHKENGRDVHGHRISRVGRVGIQSFLALQPVFCVL